MDMDRDKFIEQLRDGESATLLVAELTGTDPEIVTIIHWDIPGEYTRYGVMMAGPLMAAIVILKLSTGDIDRADMGRIRAGEPCGSVLLHMTRGCKVIERGGLALQSIATLYHRGIRVGVAQEVFTESLFMKQNSGERHAKEKWCSADSCPAALCGGPHIKFMDGENEVTVHINKIRALLADFNPNINHDSISLARGLYQPMPMNLDYAAMRRRVEAMSSDDLIISAFAYAKAFATRLPIKPLEGWPKIIDDVPADGN